jgi:dTDP-D-glucose 4,6-dehydratase
MKKYLITGAAGFIGFHLSESLLNKNETVIGFDNLNDYYDVSLKKNRLEILKKHENFTFIKGDLADKEAVFGLMLPVTTLLLVLILNRPADFRQIVNRLLICHNNQSNGNLLLVSFQTLSTVLRVQDYFLNESLHESTDHLLNVLSSIRFVPPP